MATYLICYDLNRPGQDYTKLHDAIKALGTSWWHYLDSTWIVTTSKNASQIRDELGAYLDPNDEILVVKSGKEGAWKGFDVKASSWLKDNL